jgi:AcrR family transcriptional regulator
VVSEAPRSSHVREQILAVATRLFAAQGYEATSLQQIASEVGIRKQSLLHHFASKPELRDAVLNELLARWKEKLPGILLAATAAEAQFEGVTRELVAFFAESPDRARLIVREVLDRPEEMQAQLTEHVRPVAERMAEYVRKGKKHGDLHPDVDAGAYLFQIIVLVLCGISFGDSLGGLLPDVPRLGPARERLIAELLRIGKSSLFQGSQSHSRSRLKASSGAEPAASPASRGGRTHSKSR